MPGLVRSSSELCLFAIFSFQLIYLEGWINYANFRYLENLTSFYKQKIINVIKLCFLIMSVTSNHLAVKMKNKSEIRKWLSNSSMFIQLFWSSTASSSPCFTHNCYFQNTHINHNYYFQNRHTQPHQWIFHRMLSFLPIQNGHFPPFPLNPLIILLIGLCIG